MEKLRVIKLRQWDGIILCRARSEVRSKSSRVQNVKRNWLIMKWFHTCYLCCVLTPLPAPDDDFQVKPKASNWNILSCPFLEWVLYVKYQWISSLNLRVFSIWQKLVLVKMWASKDIFNSSFVSSWFDWHPFKNPYSNPVNASNLRWLCTSTPHEYIFLSNYSYFFVDCTLIHQHVCGLVSAISVLAGENTLQNSLIHSLKADRMVISEMEGSF